MAEDAGARDVAARLREIQTAAAAGAAAAEAAATPVAEARSRWASGAERAASMADPLAFEVQRSGVAARLERAAKRARGVVAVWTTWPQAKFNEATVEVLRDTGEVLEAEERWVAELVAAHRAEIDALNEALQALRAELDDLRTHHDSSLEEHRVVMRQLALEVAEAAQLADRTRRRLDHRAEGGDAAGGASIRSA